MGNWGYNLTYIGVITILITGRGPTLYPQKFNSEFSPEKESRGPQ